MTEVREMTKDLPRKKILMKLQLDKKSALIIDCQLVSSLLLTDKKLSVGFFLNTLEKVLNLVLVKGLYENSKKIFKNAFVRYRKICCYR